MRPIRTFPIPRKCKLRKRAEERWRAIFRCESACRSTVVVVAVSHSSDHGGDSNASPSFAGIVWAVNSSGIAHKDCYAEASHPSRIFITNTVGVRHRQAFGGVDRVRRQARANDCRIEPYWVAPDHHGERSAKEPVEREEVLLKWVVRLCCSWTWAALRTAHCRFGWSGHITSGKIFNGDW
eukprot:SAG31_NODE_16620_length_702_cov_1.356551_1_plen_181_part_00